MDEYCRVLLVEDEFIMRQGIKYMMDWEKEGFCFVGEATNGREGLALVEKLKPHIVLADIVMPVMDGIEFSSIMGKRYPTVQLIILSGYDKFDYVRNTLLNGAADYILKPTINPDILLNALKKAAGMMQDFKLPEPKEITIYGQVEKLLQGYHQKIEPMYLEKEFPHKFYRLLAVDIKEKKEAMHVIKEFWEQQKEFKTMHVTVGEHILCTIINYKLAAEKQLLVLSQVLADKLEHYYENIFFIFSNNFTELSDVRNIFLRDIQAELEDAFYSQGNFLISEGLREAREFERFSFETYTMLLNQRRFEEALLMFGQYIDDVCDGKMEEHMMKNLTKNLLYNYLMEIEKYAVDSEELKEKYFKGIDETVRVADFKSIFQNIITQISNIVKEITGQDDLRIAQIKQYVAKHYAQPLDLADVAKLFNFNYSYLSSYFNRSAKEGFSEYLNKIRVGQACELLKQKESTISSIGEIVGYSEHSYFCRVFKKITGETPSGYRRRIRKEL